MKISIQSLQFRRVNAAGNKTLRFVWDVVSRDDCSPKLLIETWGGRPDGYIKSFSTDLILGNYLSKRVAKAAMGAADNDIELTMVGAEDYIVTGAATNLEKAMDAENHENAKLRLGATAKDVWDSDACLNKTIFGIIDFDEPQLTANGLVQAMASRVKTVFKKGGTFTEQMIAIDDFMKLPDNSLDDVLATGEEIDYPPMDRERIAEIIQVADGLREGLSVTVEATVTMEPEPVAVHLNDPVIRGAEWGGWA